MQVEIMLVDEKIKDDGEKDDGQEVEDERNDCCDPNFCLIFSSTGMNVGMTGCDMRCIRFVN